MKSLYHDTLNIDDFIIKNNYLEDENNINNPNEVYPCLLPWSPLSDHDDESDY